jgi:hypothetical protein
MGDISAHEPWLWADVFFLKDALQHGMSAEQVAGFLGRPAHEVRAKAREFEERPGDLHRG